MFSLQFVGRCPSAQQQKARHPSSLPTGIKKFKGRYLHSRDYKDSRDFTDKTVVVVGIGNSGSDLAVEISQAAKQVSSRTWVPVSIASFMMTPTAGTAMAPSHHLLCLTVPAPTNPNRQAMVAVET